MLLSAVLQSVYIYWVVLGDHLDHREIHAIKDKAQEQIIRTKQFETVGGDA